MNVLMIGAGMVAQTHVLALRDNGAGARLLGVLGRDADRTEQFCSTVAATLGYDVTPFDDMDAALAAGPDMALVITPPDARMGFASALVDARIPTLMEKPIERTLAAAREITSLYASADLPLGLCFQHRTRDVARALKQLLDTGDLGTVEHVEMRVPWWRDQAYYDAPGRGSYARDGGGVMINQAIHTLDLALWLCGSVARLQAMMRSSSLHRMEAEDIAAALFHFASGASGVLSATTTAYPGGAESITITTSLARAHLEGDTLRIEWMAGEVEHVGPQGDTSTGGGADPMAFTHGWHQSVLQDFVTAVTTRRPPLAPASDALHVHAVIDAMERSARSNDMIEVPQ